MKACRIARSVLCVLSPLFVSTSLVRAAPCRAEPPPPSQRNAAHHSGSGTPHSQPASPQSEEFDLEAFIAKLNPPTVEEIIASLRPIPTIEESLAPLPDDPNAPWKRVLTGEDKARVADLEKRIDGLRRQGKYAEAIPLAEEAVGIRTRMQGPGHWEAADGRRLIRNLQHVGALPAGARAKLAEVERDDARIHRLYNQGIYDEAISIARHQLDTRRRLLGNEHLDVASTLNRLAVCLTEMGDYALAEKLNREALTIRRQLIAPEHPDIAQSLNNLAMVLGREGKYEPAEKLYRQSLAMWRRLVGSEHPDIASGLNNLGHVFRRKGDYAMAESMHRQALAMRRKLLGDDHELVASDLNSLATVLKAKGDTAEAERLCREALAMHRRVFGGEHPEVAADLHNLAELLKLKGDYAASEARYREGMAINCKLLGNEHPRVAADLNDLALLLSDKGEYAVANTLYRKALTLYRRVLGDAPHPHLSTSLLNFGNLLRAQGDYAAAEPLVRQALAMDRKLLGDEHPYLAATLSSLALLLQAKGDYAAAERLLREAMAMNHRLLGDEHLHVAADLNNLAKLLQDRGDISRAEPLLREAVTLNRKLLGDEHPRVGQSMCNLARLLHTKGDYAAAETHYRETLELIRKRLGHEHPYVAGTQANLATLYYDIGNYALAGPLCHQALAMSRRLLGDKHPAVTAGLNALGALHHARGDYATAEEAWESAADSFEAVRLRVSATALGRVQFTAKQSPLPALAACLARNGKPEAAWDRLEANLARGVLDVVSARHTRPLDPEERGQEQNLAGQLNKLDERIAALAEKDAGEDALALARKLRREREELQATLAKFEADLAAKYGVVAGEVYVPDRIQAQLPTDATLLAWVDIKGHPKAADPNGEHWACVVRHSGEPIWVKLPGSGDEGAWTEHDNNLPEHVRDVLGRRPKLESSDTQDLLDRLHAQRLAPVEPYLSGVRHLIVLPAGWMAGVPVEALTDKYAVSYAPSGTIYAWLRERSKPHDERRSEAGRTLLALGDPTFAQPEEMAKRAPEPPDHGVLIAMVGPGTNAARSGLQRGDVLVSYDGQRLAGPDALGPAIQQARDTASTRGEAAIPVTVWREGQTLQLAVAPGQLGVNISRAPAPEALGAKHRLDSALASARGESFLPLPGTRREVAAIAKLFGTAKKTPAPTLLLGAEASEEQLGRLASSGELSKFRYLHLATHGKMDDEVAMRSALILSQGPAEGGREVVERVLAGREVYDGRLTAEQIVRTWKLDAELVTLSACETALGKASGGEGFLGFSQALFVAGARSLVASLWKVDDTATALLMTRFYENLLGQFAESRIVAGQVFSPGEPIPKAEALREAKQWLRDLTSKQVRRFCAANDLPLPSALARGEPGPMRPVEPPEHPFEHPYFWSAFVLMGDPGQAVSSLQ